MDDSVTVARYGDQVEAATSAQRGGRMSLTNERKVSPTTAHEFGRGVGLVAMTGASVGGLLGFAALGLRALGI